MRIAGWILLVLGLVLCVSVAWAPLGLLMMGVSLVSLQAAEQGRRKARSAVAPASTRAGKPVHESAIPHPAEPEVLREPPPIPAPTNRAPAVVRSASPDRYGYDGEEWRRLVESDPDLAQLASVLGDYGQHYVDEFARNYLTAPDKSRIAGIVDGIVARARSTRSARTTAPPAAPHREPEVAQPRTDSGCERLVAPVPTAAAEPTAQAAPVPSAAPEASAPAKGAVISSEIAAAPPLQPPPEERAIEPPKIEPATPDRPRGSAPMTSVDDDLTEMISKFTPDSSFLRRR